MKDKIIELLGRGIPATQVAAAVGCDDSYISQLLSDEDIAQQVAQLRATHFSGYIEQDDRIDSAEEAALAKVSSLIPFITRPAEAVRVFSVLNAAKRRAIEQQSTVPVAQTVTLDLPEATRVQLTVTHDKQVIEIAGKSLTTMPAKSLAAQLEQRTAARLLATPVPSRLLNASQQVIQQGHERVLATKKAMALSKQL
jgi:hypothetical protein